MGEEPDIHYCRYSNGIHLVYKQVPHSKVMHCGYTLNIGSRDEKTDEQGVAHFWEHMAFKGTRHRKAYQILNGLEKVGGELNAYTTKEKICFYSSVLSEYFERAVDILTDITFHSIFPEKELNKERAVIMEEMAMYKDAPDDAIHDEFDQMVFGQHPLGHNILGTIESIQAIDKSKLENFINHHLNTQHIAFTAVGPLSFQKVKKVLEKQLATIQEKNGTILRQPPVQLSPVHHTVKKPITQVHCILGKQAFALNHPQRIPFFVLTNLLGGPAMTARLNMLLREKYGLVYHIDASYQPYQDTGLFTIYFATDTPHVAESLHLIQKVIKDVQQNALSSLRLHYVKQQIKGQLAMAEEGNLSFMMMMGKSILDLGRIESLNEIFKIIDNISSLQLCQLANEYLPFDQLFQLTYLPENGRN